MNNQLFSELDLAALLSLSFSTLINELHDRLSELGYRGVSKYQLDRYGVVPTFGNLYTKRIAT